MEIMNMMFDIICKFIFSQNAFFDFNVSWKKDPFIRLIMF